MYSFGLTIIMLMDFTMDLCFDLKHQKAERSHVHSTGLQLAGRRLFN